MPPHTSSGTSAAEVNALPFESLAGRVITGLILAVLLLVGIGGWAAMARITSAVIAQGAVRVDQNLKQIQHRDGGIVSSIDVREGDVVQKGQVLLRLDDAQSQAELSILQCSWSRSKPAAPVCLPNATAQPGSNLRPT
jgi:multidrug efflux pump subunit AcrA (membrane-fusion protein)